jgi:hypothetical protein
LVDGFAGGLVVLVAEEEALGEVVECEGGVGHRRAGDGLGAAGAHGLVELDLGEEGGRADDLEELREGELVVRGDALEGEGGGEVGGEEGVGDGGGGSGEMG